MCVTQNSKTVPADENHHMSFSIKIMFKKKCQTISACYSETYLIEQNLIIEQSSV